MKRRRWLVWLVAVLGCLFVVVAAGLAAAYHKANGVLDRSWTVEGVDVPVPWPGSTLDEAIARGDHLVNTRLGCLECHGANAGGGVIFDAPPMGRWVAPNLTSGSGGVGDRLTSQAWDLAVRHGITSDGTTSTMPSIDYVGLSDRELSDIIAYFRSFPDVDSTQPTESLGPLRAILYATGAIPLAAELIDHAAPSQAEPPEAAATVEFGRHVAGACVGCHRQNFSGGPIIGGDPSWPPASNLTSHADGVGSRDEATFMRAMREGLRHDGAELDVVMPWRLMANMTDVELQAMYLFFQSLEPLPTGADVQR